MRLHPTLVLFGCLGLTAGAASSALAQRGGPGPVFTAGARGGRDFEEHAWSLGGQVGIRPQDRLEIRPSADWFLGDRTPYRWQLKRDAARTLRPGTRLLSRRDRHLRPGTQHLRRRRRRLRESDPARQGENRV